MANILNISNVLLYSLEINKCLWLLSYPRKVVGSSSCGVYLFVELAMKWVKLLTTKYKISIVLQTIAFSIKYNDE